MSIWKNKKVLITAGPTYEPIDPVRFIGNRSSGKMGYAIAENLAEAGAKVTLVSGPATLKLEHPNLEVISVESTQEMYEACHQYFPSTDVCIKAAAVADFTPKRPAHEKIKKEKGQDEMTIELVKTPDILYSLGQIKEKQILVGFSLETTDGLANAKGKLKRKNLDLIVLNSLQDPGAGFQGDTNVVTFIYPDGSTSKSDCLPKKEIAQLLQKAIAPLLQ